MPRAPKPTLDRLYEAFLTLPATEQEAFLLAVSLYRRYQAAELPPVPGDPLTDPAPTPPLVRRRKKARRLPTVMTPPTPPETVGDDAQG